MRGGSGRGERGAASVLTVALVALLAVVALTAAGMTALVAGHRRAQAAADLAALAGASALQDAADGCMAAARVATSNGARLVSCTVRGQEVVVAVEVRSGAIGGRRWTLPGQARAGPASEDGS
ncbi:hypothetical protein GCM10011519_24400 [Marmoricola endophyticus]|uniref:Putative Flp pilus-assembly TadG-like N-terminal domain-containing protein n=1 Tax=Marmoricola endophyticus TaxID=2040280 RepID=A0A917BMK0_9ACTN|nr:Rv3654c family TadE-like protein [Marmoricola endophyticus]GGF49588.1 hypothetical protein GCM10011519_24400 [Marmoricola endophyticus]